MVNEALPDGRLVEVPRAGHALLLDNAPEVVRVLSEFLLPVLGSGAASARPAGSGSACAAPGAGAPSGLRGG
jgi:hypothetical protein